MIIVSLNHGESGLVQVAEAQQFVSLRADVADLQGHLAVDLLLQVQVVVFHVRRLNVAVESEHIAFEVARRFITVLGNARNNRAADRSAT